MKKDNKTRTSIPLSLSRRRGLTLSSRDLVTMEYIDSARRLPLVILPQGADRSLMGWAKANLPLIQSELQDHGAILFRGFPVTGLDQFQQFVQTISGEPLPYSERTSPRTQIRGNVYTSTDYPHDQRILLHNENSYAISFPRKLFFWCQIPPLEGGQTPLADTRRILAGLHPSVLNKFIAKGWMYARNFSPHFGLSWQAAFQTSDQRQVEEYCRKAAITCEWTPYGLRTCQIRPVIAQHPESRELVWFNHASFFHITSIEPNLQSRLLAQYDERDLPNNTYYGDGSSIEDSVAQHLREVYEREMVSFDWKPGDIALIDNMLTAHGRAPFVGPRRILFAMAESYTRTDLINI